MKVLFIGLNWLGDVVMSLPAILATAKKHEVHILTRPHLAQIYRFTEAFAAIHEIPTNGLMLASLPRLRQLKSENFDQIIVLPDSLRAAIIAWLCRASSLGYNTQGRKMFLSRTLEKPENFKSIHESRLHFALVKKAGLAHDFMPLPRFSFAPEKIAQTLDEFGMAKNQPYLIFAPGAAFGAAKRWPAEKFAKLAQLLYQKKPELKILVTGSGNEADIAEKVAAAGDNSTSIAGKTSLEKLAILLSQAKAMVANDSGTMHLAAMFATPTMVPVGPTDMTRTGSLSEKVQYFYGSESCPQAPCRLKVCPRKDHICMQSIDPVEIFQAISKLGDGGQ
jgi:heptosyltransferase-2